MDAPIVFGLYFPGVVYSESLPHVQMCADVGEWLKMEGRAALDKCIESWVLLLEYRDLPAELQAFVLHTPQLTMQCFSCAAHRLIAPEELNRRVRTRVLYVDNITPFGKLKADKVDKFVALMGTIVRVSGVRPLCVKMGFMCTLCSHEIKVEFTDGAFTPPQRCVGRCKGKYFEPQRGTAETVDWQKIKLQELRDGNDQGRVPRTFEIELTEELCDSTLPGDVITVCGIVKISSAVEKRGFAGRKPPGSGGGTSTIYTPFLDASALTRTKMGDDGVPEDVVSISSANMSGIEKIKAHPEPFKLIVNSLCPAIFGHEIVKAGMILTLLGGSTSLREGLVVRTNPHMLIVGDPGLGKSQMLRAAAHVAPRGVYVCGNTATSSGLTVSVVRDQTTGDYALEAGALVLGDKGICCIDEFDKMPGEHAALLEAMEQQVISIAKAGIVCSLPARTSVIAAANPRWGHYTRAKTVSENLNMKTPLLSRFDLIYILLDDADAERDKLLSAHLMRMHAGRRAVTQHMGAAGDISTPGGPLVQQPLSLKLRVNPRDAAGFPPLPAKLLRRYLAYARVHVQPTLSQEAAAAIKEFYLDLRHSHQSSEATPITTRQLESLVRLTQARARVELRHEATQEDALEVISIMKQSLYEVLLDDTGVVDIGRVTGTSNSAKHLSFVRLLYKKAQEQHVDVYKTKELYELIRKHGLTSAKHSAEDVLAQMNAVGHLLKCNDGYKVAALP